MLYLAAIRVIPTRLWLTQKAAIRQSIFYLENAVAIYIDNRVTGIAYAAHVLDVELAALTPQFSRSQVSRGGLLLRLLDEFKKQKTIQAHQKNTNSFRHFFIILIFLSWIVLKCKANCLDLICPSN